MREEEKLKQLKMALTGRKDLILNVGENVKFMLKWDDKVSNYRGYALPEKFDMGTFGLELLLQVVAKEIEEASLEIAKECLL